MKKIRQLFLYLFVFLCLCISINVSAANISGCTVVNLQIDNPIMTVNGAAAEIDPGLGTTPIIRDSRTLVPIRAVVEAFGGNVGWEADTRTAVLGMNGSTIRLTIDSTTAYLNGNASNLDVSPVIYNNRTMLPIRFVSESFGLDVEWHNSARTVIVSDKEITSADVFIDSEFYFSPSEIPQFCGSAYTVVNNNTPKFDFDSIGDESFEYYSELDYMRRCGKCVALIDDDIMPTEKRGDISSVKPTGWHSVQYDNVSGKYLYNRCHLIGFQLTGENANPKNLITGTRYLNVDGMLPFENLVNDYVESTDNTVLYRVTPVFDGSNLLANGVLMEGYSVEDVGQGVCFSVYCHNIQPGIVLNYYDGTSYAEVIYEPPVQTTPVYDTTPQQSAGSQFVINISSKKFHIPSCGSVQKMKESNKKLSYESKDALISQGYSPCGTCLK